MLAIRDKCGTCTLRLRIDTKSHQEKAGDQDERNHQEISRVIDHFNDSCCFFKKTFQSMLLILHYQHQLLFMLTLELSRFFSVRDHLFKKGLHMTHSPVSASLFAQSPGLMESKASVYAVIRLEAVGREDEDPIAIQVPSSVSIPEGEGEILPVSYDGAVVGWTGLDGKAYQLGEPEKPFDKEAAAALRSDGGLLVLFIDAKDGDPKRWIAIRAE